MKYLKYIFLVSLLSLLVSCAKDDEISMGSLKIEAKVFNVTSTSVLIEFSNPNSILDINDILLYKINNNGESQYIGSCYTYGESHCILEYLDPNTKYTFALLIRDNDSGSFNHNVSIPNDDWTPYGTLISDPSFTFTTGDPKDYYKAHMTVDLLPGGTAVVNVSLDNSKADIGSFVFADSDSSVLVCSDPEGLSPINDINVVMGRYSYDSDSLSFSIQNLKPNTTYYVFVKSLIGFRLINNDGSYTANDVNLNLTPNSFTTGEDDVKIKAAMTTESITASEARISIKLDNSEFQYSSFTFYDYDPEITICSDPEGLSPVNDYYIEYDYINSNSNHISFIVSELKPKTTYYLFVEANISVDYKDNLYSDIQIEDTYLDLTPNSFTTL